METSEPGNKAWGSESPTVLGASRNLGTPTTRGSAPVFRCIEKEAGVLTRGDGLEESEA